MFVVVWVFYRFGFFVELGSGLVCVVRIIKVLDICKGSFGVVGKSVVSMFCGVGCSCFSVCFVLC